MSVNGAQDLTQREILRREIASQIESFLQRGGHIDMLSAPGMGEVNPVGRIWWEAGGNLRGAGLIIGNSV
jgi:hypothetical protein